MRNFNPFNQHNLYRSSLTRLALLLVLAWVLVQGSAGPWLSSGLQTAAAQTSGENWTIPVNLSHSGSAQNPLFIISPEGEFHIVWSDDFAGYMYTRGDGIEWSDPKVVSLPFGTYTPHLISDPSGLVHAFWLDEQNNLLYSRVAAENFGITNAWQRGLRLAGSVVDVDVSVDATGRIHLGFIQIADIGNNPAGVYYLKSSQARTGWSAPVLLYESPYFRSLTQEVANVKISTDITEEEEKIFVAWDNPSRERVFNIRSIDGGETWDEPVEVDAPIEGTIAGGPANIIVNAFQDKVILIWQTDRSGDNCTQYYQWSVDGGDTWGPRQRMLQDLRGCPQDNQLLVGEDGTIFLLTNLFRQLYLLAWDGERWSNPQSQATLTRFVDPETFKPVDFGCRQATLVGGSTLFVVGCDTGSGRDIWYTSRQLENVSTWFSQAPVWEPPILLTQSQMNILDPALVTDVNQRVHLFWSQADSSLPDSPGKLIYYTRLEAGEWSTPLPVLSIQENIARQPAAAVDPQGNLLVVWSGGPAGGIYFSRAIAARAVIAAAWSEPQLLPSPQLVGTSPDILVDHQGRIYVIYAIPLNEQRGIYMTLSEDGGQTWSEPWSVFDADRAGWAMIDRPQLTLGSNGQLHLLWTQYSLPGSTGPLALYYARSDDEGFRWSQAELVTENPVVWSQIISVNEKTVHRVWQEISNNRTTLWHEWSLDGGITWERISPASIFGDTVGEPALAGDRAGRLHLSQIVSRGANNFILQTWLWDGSNWHADQSLDLSGLISAGLGSMVSTVSTDDNIGIAFASKLVNSASGLQENSIFFTSRLLEMPAIEPGSLPAVAPTPVPPVVTATLPPQPTPTPTLFVSGTGDAPGGGGLSPDPGGPGNAWLGSIVGPIAAGLIVLLVLIFGLRRFGPDRR